MWRTIISDDTNPMLCIFLSFRRQPESETVPYVADITLPPMSVFVDFAGFRKRHASVIEVWSCTEHHN